MAALSFRDRFFTRKVSHAVTAPSSILTFGAAAAVGILAAPAAIPVAVFGLGAGLVAYGAKVLLAVPRAERAERIDPFGVNEPWRRFVAEALQARDRFEQSVSSMRSGPLRDTLDGIGDRLQVAVDECWRVACRGQAVADARAGINVETARYELDDLRHRASGPFADASMVERTAEALRSQVASAERMERLLVETVDRLRLLDARMDETVTRAIELAVQADSPDDLGGLGADVDGLVLDMEALRQALDETASAGRTGSFPVDFDSTTTTSTTTSPEAPGSSGGGQTSPPSTATGSS